MQVKMTEKDIVLRAFHNLAERDARAAMALLVECNLRTVCCESDLDYDLGIKYLDRIDRLNREHYKVFHDELKRVLDNEDG